MTSLLVLPPQLSYQPLPGGFAPVEEPLGIAVPPVRFPDGTEIAPDELTAAHILITRAPAATAPAQVWDHAARRWRDALSIDPSQLQGLPLLPPQTPGSAWSGVVVAMGQKDAAGSPMIGPSVGGFPQYRLRAVFRAVRGGQAALGLSATSAQVQFASKRDSARFTAVASPDDQWPARIQFVLRSASAQPVGMVEIDASGGGSAVTLRSFDGGGNPEALVELRTNGDIRLTPAPGRRVVIAGDLEVERVTYLPAAGLPKKTLN